MTEDERIAALESRVKQLEAQVLAMSELLGNQSNLIVTLSTQQTEASRSAAQINQMLASIARLVEPAE